MFNYYTGGYISTLSLMKELICALDCDCLSGMNVYEEIESSISNKKTYGISVVDTIVTNYYQYLDIEIAMYLPQHQPKKIVDIVNCLTCVPRNFTTDNYIFHEVKFKKNDLRTAAVTNNSQKIYDGTYSVIVSKINKE